jgi:hypothetical protein
MNIKKLALWIFLAALVTGCVTPPQQPVQMNRAALASGAGKIGVVMTAMPKVNTSFPGASCLLCVAAAEGANSALTKHAQTLPNEGLGKLQDSIAQVLVKTGVDAQAISEPLQLQKLPEFKHPKGENAPAKDFQSLRAKYNVDRLLVIDLTAIGFVRTYSAYFPTSDPKAYVAGSAYIVDLTNNHYDLYQRIDIQKSADGAWDEPPQYPGLTNAYFQIVEMIKDRVKEPLKR